jgi:hypothetical protein
MNRSRLIKSIVLLLDLAALAGCAEHERGVTVAAEDARACDVLVDVGGRGTPVVDFGPEVRGASSRHGARLGISWASAGDAPFHRGAVTLRGAPSSKILTSTCYDRDGRPIANPNVTLL